MNLDLLFTKPNVASPVQAKASTASLVVAGLLIMWSSYIHFHLWQSFGYRHIPSIGPLFLVQSLGGLFIGIVVVVFRRIGSAVLGIGFALATIAGFLLSVTRGTFGFKDTWSAPYAVQAFVIELAIVVLLTLGAGIYARQSLDRQSMVK